MLGLTVSKTILDSKCDLETAVAWAVSAKNSLRNVNGYSPNQLVFGKNPNFPNVFDNKLPALKCCTTSEIVATNLNAMQSARKEYLKSEASEKISRALRHQVRTYGDMQYDVGDKVYFTRKVVMIGAKMTRKSHLAINQGFLTLNSGPLPQLP